MSDLLRTIELTKQCRAAARAGDGDRAFALMTQRDESYLTLSGFDASTYIEWARGRMPDPIDNTEAHSPEVTPDTSIPEQKLDAVFDHLSLNRRDRPSREVFRAVAVTALGWTAAEFDAWAARHTWRAP